MDPKVKAYIRELEDRNAELLKQVLTQGDATKELSEAGLSIRLEDVQQIADYKETNTKLWKFVRKVAESRSKFAGDAQELLGFKPTESVLDSGRGK